MATVPSDRAQLRRQSRQLGLILAAIALSAAFRNHQSLPIAATLGVVGITLVVFAVVIPEQLIPMTRVWLRLGVVLHYVVGPIVLGALWLGIFAPVGFVRRTFGKDPMHRKYDRTAASYWRTREQRRYSLEDFRQQF
jgi:hypothetical protein